MCKMTREIQEKIFILLKKIFPEAYELQTKYRYYIWNGKWLNLRNPMTYSEKINYLKLHVYGRSRKITECVDKCSVHNYLERRGYGAYNPVIYAVYDRPEEIQWDQLPNSFVIKCNHGSGLNIFCKDKKKIDRVGTITKLKEWLDEDFWKRYAELQYKNIRKKIIIEEYLGDRIETYRICCFHGSPRAIYIMTTRNGYDYADFYDLRWKKMDLVMGCGGTEIQHKCPEKLDEMLELAKRLSRPFPFVRIDLYEVGGKVYFSEFTFMPSGGYTLLWPDKYEVMWGNWIKLKNSARQESRG